MVSKIGIDNSDLTLDQFEDSEQSILAFSQPTMTVSEINETIAEAIDEYFPEEVWVKGEIQRLNFHSSGHIYFNLCDSEKSSNATIPVSLFKYSAAKIKTDLREILVEDREVRLKVKPNFYAPYGKMSLVVSDVDTDFTLGQIAIARRKLLEKLEKEGILRSNAQHEIDELCMEIALVTALDSAAYHDVTDQLKSSGFGYRIKVVNALMQGSGSEDSVAKALEIANDLEPDVVLLCRGGGSKSDLSSFDSEKIARAICSMEVPVITGLGHQIDVSVADLVAHTSFKTPTACAQFLIDRTRKSIDEVIEFDRQIRSLVTEKLLEVETRLGFVSRQISDSGKILEKYLIHLEMMKKAVLSGARNLLDSTSEYLKSKSQIISAYDPERVLERGFSLTLDVDGKAIRSKKSLKIGSSITTKFVDGEIVSKVEKVKE